MTTRNDFRFDDQDAKAEFIRKVLNEYLKVATPPPKPKKPKAKRYSLDDWQLEVREGNTRLGYDEWIDHMKESEKHDKRCRGDLRTY